MQATAEDIIADRNEYVKSFPRLPDEQYKADCMFERLHTALKGGELDIGMNIGHFGVHDIKARHTRMEAYEAWLSRWCSAVS